MNRLRGISRRDALKLAAVGSALPLVHVRTAHAAGSIEARFLGPLGACRQPGDAKNGAGVGQKNKVQVSLDLLSSGAVEQQAAADPGGRGARRHRARRAWRSTPGTCSTTISISTPIDDVMEAQIKKYGAVDATAEYLAKVNGHWMAMPTSVGSQYKPSCARISFFNRRATTSGMVSQQARQPRRRGAAWTYDLMLKLAPAAQKAGMPFGMGLGQTTDSVDWTGAMLRALRRRTGGQGRQQPDRSEPVQQVLEYMQKLVPVPAGDTAATMTRRTTRR